MPLNFSTTSSATRDQGVKILVHGPPGAGKTMLCATAPDPVILSAEAGLLSLSAANQQRVFGASRDIPVIHISGIKDLKDAYTFLATSPHAKAFRTVCLDSVSEIAEQILNEAREGKKDGRQAYGELNMEMTRQLRQFRDLPGLNVVFVAKQEREKDEATGLFLYGPSMPGKTLTQGISYFFDEVFALSCIEDKATKVTTRWLRTRLTNQFSAKDRSGALEEFEEPNLTSVIGKIQNQ